MRLAHSRWLAITLVLAFGIAGFGIAGLAQADDPIQHQIPQSQFGVSGGNANDETARFCCSGTLGGLVTDGSNLFILSNNHVLARSNRADIGEDIVQPGLIDNNCNPGTVVAHLTLAPPLGSQNVDAAIAQLVPGTMDTNGLILNIGQISAIPRQPSIGLSVQKSGRTTGVTSGTIQAINAATNVTYHKRCVPGKRFSVVFDNQIIIGGASFSDSGDSGALIVTGDACHQPVGLLVGGGTNNTSANGIGDVLSALQVAVVGSNITCSGSEITTAQRISPESLLHASSIANRHKTRLMSRPGIVAVGVGASTDQPGEAAIIIYVNQAAVPLPPLPTSIDGVPVRIELTDEFVAR